MNPNKPTAYSDSLFGNIKRLLGHLSSRRRWQLLGLLAFMLLGAVAELATLGAVLPFLAILTEPAQAFKYPLLQNLFTAVGWADQKSILLPTTLLFAIMAILGAAIRMALIWISIKFSFGVGIDLGVEVYRRTLYQPYSFHVAHNTSEIIAGLNKVQGVVYGIVSPLIQMLVSLLITVSILGALFWVEPTTATVSSLGFALIYLTVTLSTRRKLRLNSKLIADADTQQVQTVQEGLGGIRDILIDGTQGFYINRFRNINAVLRRAQAANTIIGTAPRYLIESISMVLIAALAYWLCTREGGLSTAIPVLGALALGAQRLMPQMQQIYYGWATINGNRTILAEVIERLKQPIPAEYFANQPADILPMERGIVLRDVCFRYRLDSPEVISRLNLQIPSGSRIGFIGKTGSGKSTLIDLILGLLEPTSGHIEIDGITLRADNRRAWQLRIAHVPQSIFLADSTIAENIAFGIDRHHIDLARIREAARKAQLANFIETLPDKYQSVVGERGVRLSGGQRQRIGLARAFYKEATVLVLDEATSALDDATEKEVIQAIDALGNDITVLMIAHRVSTLSSCDCIFEIQNGNLMREGSYQDLIQRSIAI